MAGGFRLTDETYTLSPVQISRKEAFSFGLARKLLAHYEGTRPILWASSHQGRSPGWPRSLPVDQRSGGA